MKKKSRVKETARTSKRMKTKEPIQNQATKGGLPTPYSSPHCTTWSRGKEEEEEEEEEEELLQNEEAA